MENDIIFNLWSITKDGVTEIPWKIIIGFFVYYGLLSASIFSIGFSNYVMDKNLENIGVKRPISFSMLSFLATVSIAGTFIRFTSIGGVKFSPSLLTVLGILMMMFILASVFKFLSEKLIAISYILLVFILTLTVSIELETLIFLVPTALSFVLGFLLYRKFSYRIANFWDY
jgi:hypothetical protein